jgi:hypothetical protein
MASPVPGPPESRVDVMVTAARPAYELAMRYVADGLDAWEAGHRAEIDALRAVWRQRVAEARILRQG